MAKKISKVLTVSQLVKKHTLDELIGECAGWFNSLERVSENVWRAYGMDSTVVGVGTTRKRAVAGLFDLLIARRAL